MQYPFISEAKVMVESLRMLITQLVEDVYMLPSQFGYLFKMMESRLDDLNIKTPHNCAGLKVLFKKFIQIADYIIFVM